MATSIHDMLPAFPPQGHDPDLESWEGPGVSREVQGSRWFILAHVCEALIVCLLVILIAIIASPA